MEDTTTGWVIENQNHPNTNTKYIVASTFRPTRKQAIKAFVEGSGQTWRYWREAYNFRAVRAYCVISTIV